MKSMQMFSFFTVLVLLQSTCFAYYGQLKTPDASCSDAGRAGFCADCQTLVLCGDEGESSEVPCTAGLVCKEIGSAVPTCLEPIEVPECECTSSTGLVISPDPYDEQKFDVCVNGDLTVQKCPLDEIFDPEVGDCVPPPSPTTTTGTTTEVPPCNPLFFEVIKISCTEYLVCYTGGTNSGVQQCPPGEIFDERVNECRFYELFSCSNYPGTGEYADTTDCSVFHLCNQGVEVGTPGVCPGDQVYNNNTNVCTDDVTQCSALEDCGICLEDTPYNIMIDCSHYYHCTLNSDTGLYEPIYTTCPSGYYFDEATLICSLDVDECIPTLRKSLLQTFINLEKH